MTEPKAQGQEPTMEEILASIRRIISENDDPNAAAAAPAKAVSAAARAQPGDDGVLELTDMVGADGKVVDIAVAKGAPSVNIPEPPAKEEFPTMADPNPDPVPQPATADVPADDVELSAAQPRSGDSDEPLIAAGTAAVSTAAFTALAQQLGRKGDEGTVGAMSIGSGRTLEDLVKELLRPMLREWLDANLPGTVERMVKREIERIVRRAED
jgi:hypothetical protein